MRLPFLQRTELRTFYILYDIQRFCCGNQRCFYSKRFTGRRDADRSAVVDNGYIPCMSLSSGQRRPEPKDLLGLGAAISYKMGA